MISFLRCALLCAMVFFPGLLIAQPIRVPGYYVTNEGDTVRGSFPAYSEWSRNPASVSFQPAGSEAIVELTPAGCRSFRVDGYETYRSYHGQRLVNPTEDFALLTGSNGNIPSGPENVYDSASIFLRLAAEVPAISLYMLRDRQRTNFFYALPGDTLVELRFKKYLATSFDSTRVMEIREVADFRRQLDLLFHERILQKKLMPALERLAYSERELSSFLRRLFDAPAHTAPSAKWSGWLVSAGVAWTNVVLTTNRTNIYARDLNAAVSPSIAVGHILPLQRNFAHVFLYPQLKLYTYKVEATENLGSVTYNRQYSADLMGALTMQVGYNFSDDETLRVFVAGGAGLATQVGAKETMTTTTPGSNPPFRAITSVAMNTLLLTAQASLGMNLQNRYYLLATYNFPSGFSKFVSYDLQLSGVQLQLGYRFQNKK